jgi:SAM-dependent methyltransferase
MHTTAISNAELFFSTYLKRDWQGTIVEIGAQDVNGSLRSLCPSGARYIGVDFVAGKGVDIVLEDPYKLPLDDATVDVVVSSSVFEHSEMFWLLFVEVLRTLKPAGLFYLNTPSNGDYHQYPVDCWRFYPDSGQALANWAKRCGYNAELLESFISAQSVDVWSDCVAVFIKDAAHAERYPHRMLDVKKDFYNGRLRGKAEILRQRGQTEDLMKLDSLMRVYGERTPRWRHRLAKLLLGV